MPSANASGDPCRSTFINHVELARSSNVNKSENNAVGLLALIDMTNAPAVQVAPGIVSTIWYTPARHAIHGHDHFCAPVAVRTNAAGAGSKKGRPINSPCGFPVPCLSAGHLSAVYGWSQ